MILIFVTFRQDRNSWEAWSSTEDNYLRCNSNNKDNPAADNSSLGEFSEAELMTGFFGWERLTENHSRMGENTLEWDIVSMDFDN